MEEYEASMSLICVFRPLDSVLYQLASTSKITKSVFTVLGIEGICSTVEYVEQLL